MTTEQHVADASRPATSLWRRTGTPVCGCGQDLDVCTGTHCPRCGTSLLRHAA